MSLYSELTREELEKEFGAVKSEYEHLCSLHLSLDMSRGKPGFDNMDLSEKMFDLVGNDTKESSCALFRGMTATLQ